MNKKGFTLIEMLIVVAIIGILATIVLGPLGSSRSKAKDAQIISDVRAIQALQESQYNAVTGVYIDISTSTQFKSFNQNDKGQVSYSPDFHAYAIYAPLVTNNNIKYCVDSSGASGVTDPNSTPTNGVCGKVSSYNP
ncbi:MAG: type IV pilin protein [Minisyncoccia bacterium]